jgi:two-component system, chemotaxis family, sensor kinase CheA
MTSQMDFTQEELNIFLQEATSLIDALDEQIVRLEQEGASDLLVQEIFRVAHTLKGSSAMLGFERMSHVTHAMEDLFDRVRKGTLTVSEEIVDALLMGLDVLKVLRDQIGAGSAEDMDVSAIVAALEAAAAGGDAQRVQTADRSLATFVAGDAGLAAHVRATAASGRELLEVGVAISPESDWAAVRCFQVLNELDQYGEVIASIPTQAEIEAEQVGSRVDVLLALRPEAGADAMQRALQVIDDVTAVTVEPFDIARLDEASVAPPPPSTEASAAAEAAAPGVRMEALQSTVRIEVTQLDALMNMVGELVIDRTRVSQLSKALSERFGDDEEVRSLSETATHIEKVVDELHEGMMQVRMLPIGLLLSRYPRLVRDLSRSLGKSIRLELEGEDTEIDRSIIDQIKDPLVHLIRNACDHGIEAPDKRCEAGKPELSILRLTARHEQGQIVVALADDGRGIDAARVKATAVERGLLTAETAERMSDREAVDLIFQPGLSTAESTTEVSGRGVGMDIVRRDIESFGGRIEVITVPGQGTTFRLNLPLTLATFRGLLVGCGQTAYAVPLTYVQETLRPEQGQVQTLGGHPVLHLRTRDSVMPMIWLDELLNARDASGVSSRADPYVVVVRAGESETDRPIAIAVDRLIDQQDVVVKSLSGFLGRARGIAGASILGDGRVVLILDVPSLIKSSQQSEQTGSELAMERVAS